jgi:hypothetical protein
MFWGLRQLPVIKAAALIAGFKNEKKVPGFIMKS